MSKRLLRKCQNCGRRFFTEGEKKFYDEHNFKYPKLCKRCRELKKQLQRQAEKEVHAIEAFLEQDALGYVRLEELEIAEPDHTLVIIGNGFDKMHGVPSGYYNFRDSMGKHNELRQDLEWLIDSDDVWGNFEENLARLDYSLFYGMLDEALKAYGSYQSYRESGSIADIHAPAEMLMNPVDSIVRKLPQKFREWVDKLETPHSLDKVSRLIKPGMCYLNFNYTEFLETVYGVAHEDITYIHGFRKNPGDILVVGHSEENDYLPPEPKGVPYYKDPVMLGVFEEAALDIGNHMNWYDDAMTKHTKQIISENKAFFESRKDIRSIVTLGHSLSQVDWPYFEELIKSSGLHDVRWMISFYSEEDLVRIYYFCRKMRIKAEKITLVDLSEPE